VLSLSSDQLTESELYDYRIYRLSEQLAPVPGTLLPLPYGGKIRQAMVDIDPAKLAGIGPTPMDVTNGITIAILRRP
jgi:multidrug efflux pump subunit AcrB